MAKKSNPFSYSSINLLKLDSRDIADQAVIDTVCILQKLGQDQCDIFVKERLVSQTVHRRTYQEK